MNYIRFVTGLLILFFTNYSYSQNSFKYNNLVENNQTIDNWKYCEGDSIKCDNNFVDDGWKDLKVSDDSKYINLPDSELYLLLTKIALPASFPMENGLSLTLYSPGTANEVYWDNVLINENGSYGKNLSSEIPGKVLQNIQLPSDLIVPGDHNLLIRVSNFHRIKSRIVNVAAIGTHKNQLHSFEIQNYSVIIIATIFFTSAIFSLIFFFGFNKNPAYLFFSFFSFSFTIKTIIEAVTIFPDMKVNDFDILISLVYPIVIMSGILLTAFILYKFSLSRRKEILLSFIIFSIICYPLLAMRYYIVAMIIVALVIVVYTTYKKIDGSVLSLTGLIGFSLFTYFGYMDIMNYGYFAGVIFFIFCIMISLTRQIARQNLLHNQAVIRASRLESQLLKKNIQPHFILNSLTSLQELVEQSPAKAVELIDSLAEEFRVMSKISGEKLIPVSEELKICNAHLRIMEFRRESKFKIETKNINGDEMVPPALFHTLVENGLTHGYGEKDNGYFLLSKEDIEKGVRYKFFNDSDSGSKNVNDKKGTGIKYIEARLEESYPGCWKFEQYPVDNGWQAVIEIFNSEI